MATNRMLRRPAKYLEYRVDADIDFEVGDLMFYASSTVAHATAEYVYPMADFIWDTSEEVTRRNAVPFFAGVALERRTGREAQDSVMILPSGCIFEMTMTSGTPLQGTLLGFEKASGNTLESATLQIVTDIADAIGYCVKRYTAATTRVQCVLFSAFDEIGGLMARRKFLTFGACDMNAAADLVTNWLFKSYVKLLSITSIERTAITANSVLTVKNGANSLDDTHTVTATGVGTYLRTEIADANAYDMFLHNDAMDIACDGTASAGTADVIVEYMETPTLET